MKNKLFKILLLGVLAISTVTFTKSYRNYNKYNAKITSQKAEQLAFSHAKVSRNDATVKRTKLDRENGRVVYEVEFYDRNNQKYEYEVDANTGAIVSYEHKTERNYNNRNNDTTKYIGEARAKSIALKRVNGARDNNVVKLKLDREDGRMVYEGKIIYNNAEYEFDIDAITGNVISWEEKRF